MKTEYSYDHQGRMLEETVSISMDESYTSGKMYDKAGNVRFETDRNGNRTEYTYDRWNRKLSKSWTVNGEKQTEYYTYDKRGNVVKTTDRFGSTTESLYDVWGRVVGIRDAYGKLTQKREYNLDGVQTKLYLLQEGGEYSVTAYTYDKMNRLIKTEYPEGNATETGYDALGMVVWEKDGRGNTVSYTRDLLGRVTNVTNALGQVTEYTYDTEGNKLSAKDGKGNTWRWEYDEQNRVAREIDPGGISGRELCIGEV